MRRVVVYNKKETYECVVKCIKNISSLSQKSFFFFVTLRVVKRYPLKLTDEYYSLDASEKEFLKKRKTHDPAV